MKKTFWSVEYRNWGADSASVRWFDDRDEAYKFANNDYRDKPVAHTYSNPDKIAEAEERVNLDRHAY